MENLEKALGQINKALPLIEQERENSHKGMSVYPNQYDKTYNYIQRAKVLIQTEIESEEQ